MRSKRKLCQVVSVTMGLLVEAAFLLVQCRPGIQLTTPNTAATSMRSVVLRVTDVARELGDLPPGASATARANPSSESDLQIACPDSDTTAQRLHAGGYSEPGDWRTVQVSIKDGTIEKHEQDIK